MTTKIEWTERTWNPIVGCTKVSPGCKNCYAERMAVRLRHIGTPGYEDVTEGKRWTGKVALRESALNEPLRRKRPTMYFVNSMSDLFHEDVTHDMFTEIWSVMSVAKWHTFQVLTKRPSRMLELVSDWTGYMKNGKPLHNGS